MRERGEDAVARAMTERVVDGLEVVEVEEEESPAGAVAAGLRQREAQLLLQAPPAEQVRERIAVGESQQPCLEALPLGDDGPHRDHHEGNNAHEGLQEQQGLVGRVAGEGTEAPERSSDGDRGEQQGGRRGFALSEAKGRPQQHGDAQEVQGVVPPSHREHSPENQEPGQRDGQGDGCGLERLASAPARVRVSRPRRLSRVRGPAQRVLWTWRTARSSTRRGRNGTSPAITRLRAPVITTGLWLRQPR